MVDTLTLVLAGVLAYSAVAYLVRRSGYLPDHVKVSGPITTLHTERGKIWLDRLARHRRFWRAFANVGLGFGLLVMVGMFLTVVSSGILGLRHPETNPIKEPTNALVFPGVNDYLPLAAAPEIIFGLAVAMIVHEGGHGLLCRVEDIDIDSMGLALLTVIPIGAFVEPDEESQRAADRGAKSRMFAAGVTNNFALTIVAVLLLFGPVAGSIQPVDGTPVGSVLPGSPADRAGLEKGDVITTVNGSRVTLASGETVTVDRSPIVVQALVDGPFNLAANDTIVAVNGTRVETVDGFEAAIENRTVATLRTATGNETTAPVGAYVAAIVENAPLADAGAPAGKPMVITGLGGHRIHNKSDLLSAMANAQPGDTVVVAGYVNGSAVNYSVTLGQQDGPDDAFLGVAGIQPGYSGVVVSDFGFGIRPYPAERTLALLGGGSGEFDFPLSYRVIMFLMFPFLTMLNPSAFGFAGFIGTVTNFYTVTGPLAVLGSGGVFLLANLLFWTAWINLNVGLFNLIPLFPLDGGHLLRTSAEGIVSRTPFSKRWAVRAVTVSVGLVMFGSLLVMLFGPILLT